MISNSHSGNFFGGCDAIFFEDFVLMVTPS